ncbi:class I SAM-dependent methyltransferase [Zavarzinia sp. CC-PAN008]|uniref:class I SAM-dependent methyltransferase n=1 Tax=Zavarzinia sp. CC-PAN008 TaxID=3243332 RepID=UPI003F743B73
MSEAQPRTEPGYWDKVWQGTGVPSLADPGRPGLFGYIYRRMHEGFVTALDGHPTQGRRMIEIGCGGSGWLPYFKRYWGFDVSGLDYSDEGVATARAVLAKAGIDGTIVQGDMFAPPPDLLTRFDLVWTNGLVEHFDDPVAALRALSRFLAPGGLMVTLVPNMTGPIGTLQRLADRDIYDIHVVHTPESLAAAHAAAGLRVVRCRHWLAANWGVVNFGSWEHGRAILPLAVAKRAASLPFWAAESMGALRPNRFTSPYIVCEAVPV